MQEQVIERLLRRIAELEYDKAVLETLMDYQVKETAKIAKEKAEFEEQLKELIKNAENDTNNNSTELE